jgi:metal-dependent amidase/aminoacylase/carboxypeptidase family protein
VDLLADARSFADDCVDLRRRLHREPEVGLELPRTQETVLAALDGLELEITTSLGSSSVTAVIRGGARRNSDAPTVLLRGDMDALPMEEKTGLDFAASNGAMHACGHDLHTASLVGADHGHETFQCL